MALPTTIVLMLAGLASTSASASVSASTAAAVQVAAGQGLFAVCEACHGIRGEGNRELGAPRIAGLEPWYFVRQIAGFRSGYRGMRADDAAGQQMRAMAATLENDGMVADVMAYLATMTPPREAATLNGNLRRGQAIFRLCVACHGADAHGHMALGAPALAGRDDWYLLRQLQGFRAGRRGAAAADIFGSQMRAIAVSLPDESALRDVIAFISTLQ